jgi:hypothetical protein
MDDNITDRKKFLRRLLDFVGVLSGGRLIPAQPVTSCAAYHAGTRSSSTRASLFARRVEVSPNAHLLARARSGALDAARAETFPILKAFFCRNFSARKPHFRFLAWANGRLWRALRTAKPLL